MPPDQKSLFDQPSTGESSNTTRWLTFKEARAFARTYGFEYKEEWELFVNGRFPSREPLPGNIPPNPDFIYRYTVWKNWNDWLVPEENRKDYSSFTRAREFVRCLRIKDIQEWRNYILGENKIHESCNITLPSKPDLEYWDKGWKDWNDWLGSDINYHDLSRSKKFVASLKLKNRAGWEDYCNKRMTKLSPKPENIFTYPDIGYREKGWLSWDDWLGVNKDKASNQVSPDFKECRCKGLMKNCPECDGKGFV